MLPAFGFQIVRTDFSPAWGTDGYLGIAELPYKTQLAVGGAIFCIDA